MTKHLPRLDSLRGIAAIMVGGFHAGMSGDSTVPGLHLTWILSLFLDGRVGVSIFFVLSGLVLGMSLRRGGDLTPMTYLHFCGRRFFRLYPAYFASAVFYLLLYELLRMLTLHGQPIGTGLCDYYVQLLPLSKLHLVENFCFLDQSLNIPSWTLKVEAQAAFILPLLHIFSLRFRGKGEALLLAILIGLSFLPHMGSTRINLYLFYLGYLIPQLLEILRRRLSVERFSQSSWLIAMAIFALMVSHLFARAGMELRFGVLFAALGSTLLLITILLSPAHPIFDVLDNRWIKFAGMISYSFYLFNWLSVDLTQRAFCFATGRIPAGTFTDWVAIFSVSTLLCMTLATCSFYCFERPGVKLGSILLPPKKRIVLD